MSKRAKITADGNTIDLYMDLVDGKFVRTIKSGRTRCKLCGKIIRVNGQGSMDATSDLLNLSRVDHVDNKCEVARFLRLFPKGTTMGQIADILKTLPEKTVEV